jgi:hypothetical protein
LYLQWYEKDSHTHKCLDCISSSSYPEEEGDHYWAEVQENNNVLTKHVMKTDQHYCSCLEWQHTLKPCQHALVVIIAQPFRDVTMEYFVDEYFSVQKFKKADTRRVKHLGDRSFWLHVSIAPEVGAPMSKRLVGRQWKNRIKRCLEVGGSSERPSSKANERQKNYLWQVQMS